MGILKQPGLRRELGVLVVGGDHVDFLAGLLGARRGRFLHRAVHAAAGGDTAALDDRAFGADLRDRLLLLSYRNAGDRDDLGDLLDALVRALRYGRRSEAGDGQQDADRHDDVPAQGAVGAGYGVAVFHFEILRCGRGARIEDHVTHRPPAPKLRVTGDQRHARRGQPRSICAWS